jgi:hypothetical protein
MTFEELLEIDRQHNHPDRVDYNDTVAEIAQLMSEGWSIIRKNNTVIVNRGVNKEEIEYHCFNAESGTQLAKNVVSFLDDARSAGFKIATTPYQNPRINELFKHTIDADKLEIQTTKTGFNAIVRL